MAIDTAYKKLAVMEMGEYFEPGLPLSPSTIDWTDQQVLLWGYVEVWFQGSDVNNVKLALMEFGDVWEPGLPVQPGLIEQDDKQQLLLGYPAVLWGDTVVMPSSSYMSSIFRGIAQGFARGLR